MFLALAHMCDATQLMGGGGDDDVPCTHADHSDLFSLCGTQVAKM